MRHAAISLVATTSLIAINGAAFAAKMDAAGPPLATPPGVTLEIINPQGMIDPQVAAANNMAAGGIAAFVAKITAFADANGKSLYTFDKDEPGKSACTDACATAWPPFLAPANAAAVGDWSVVMRDGGAKQWAFKGKPLYTSTKDEKPGDGKGHNFETVWRLAAFEPAAEMPLPPGIAVKETMNFDGQVLVLGNGRTLYTSDADKPGSSSCTATCLENWAPWEAPRVASPVGDFTTINRPDGARQWAYKGKALYTYAGDVNPGDANGADAGKTWHPAMLVKYFRPSDVTVRMHAKHGPMLATASGMTLYARDAHRFTLAGGAHDDRAALRGTPATGRRIGLKGCTDDCLATWTPLKAPADAQASGLWTVVTREDGTRQWAYNTYPLFTYNDDKQPGSALGHDIYQMTDGFTGLFWRVALP